MLAQFRACVLGASASGADKHVASVSNGFMAIKRLISRPFSRQLNRLDSVYKKLQHITDVIPGNRLKDVYHEMSPLEVAEDGHGPARTSGTMLFSSKWTCSWPVCGGSSPRHRALQCI